MFTKVTAVLLIASVAFAAHVSFSEKVSAKIDDDLVKLEKTLNATIETAGQQILQLLIGYNHTAIEVENRTVSALNTLGESNQKELDELKAKAKAANVSIDECLGQNETTLLDLTKVFEKENIKCVSGLEFGVMLQANGTFLGILQIRRSVSEIREEIEKCAEEEECLEKLEKRIEIETRGIPLSVEGELMVFSTYVETIATVALRNCENETVEREEDKAKSLLLKITTCVNDKLKK